MDTSDFRTDGEALIITAFMATIIMIAFGGIITVHSPIITTIFIGVITEDITTMCIIIGVWIENITAVEIPVSIDGA